MHWLRSGAQQTSGTAGAAPLKLRRVHEYWMCAEDQIAPCIKPQTHTGSNLGEEVHVRRRAAAQRRQLVRKEGR